MAVVGNLSIDRIAGAPPRIGGGPYHAARAIRLLAARGELYVRCAEADRRFLLPRLAALGMPLRVVAGRATAAFSFEYDGDRRTMNVDEIGDTWTPRDARAVDRRVRWLHVVPLLRSDFPTETLAELARGRRLLLDGHGLVREPETGPLRARRRLRPRPARHVTDAQARRGGGRARRRRRRAGARDHARLARRDRARGRPRDARHDAAARRATRPAPATRSRPRTSSRARPGIRPPPRRAARPQSWERRCDEGRSRRPSTAPSRSISRPRRSSPRARSTFARRSR